MKRLVLALTLPLFAQASFAETKPEGRNLAELSFASVDANGNGFIDMGENSNYGGDVFYSMDADDNGRLTEEEFLGWGFGYGSLAEESDKELAYRTALRVVFSFWDRDADGEITPTEHRKSLARDFQRADLDDDALLSESEYVRGFSVLVAIRAALKPENL
ncbi:EF-hand domain-containing protein [Aliiroseovarius sp. 2305UL8-7]|uniref:EF-hand domain-containing protein n=1 Tax=Aliiroseovarius conchicola TaxID=3121637 RepID=UPI0035296AF7